MSNEYENLFDGNYRQKTHLFNRKVVRKIILLSMISLIFIYGATDYIIANTIKVDIFNMISMKKMDSIRVEVFPDNENYIELCYMVVNSSPYNVKLKITSNGDIKTNYSGEVIEQGRTFYIWIDIFNKGDKSMIYEIKISGVRA